MADNAKVGNAGRKTLSRSLAALRGEAPAPGIKTPAEPANRSMETGAKTPAQARETGGPMGPEPTRYGDWERKGRCIDF